MAVQLTTDLSANLHSYYVKKALKVFEPRLQLYKLGQKTSLPKGTGKLATWLQWTAIAGSTSALTEGANPSEGTLSTANVTATIAQYGQFAKVSDLLVMTAIDPIIQSASERYGHAARKSVESLIVAQLNSTLTARYANGVANADAVTASDTLTMKDFIKSMISLKVGLVGPHESGKYVAVLHPSTEYDLISEENMHAWLSVRERAAQNAKEVSDGDIGSLFGMRFMVSDQMTAANNATPLSVKNNYLIGEECFGVVDISGDKDAFQIIVKNPGKEDTSNALNMFSTVGYKLKGFVAKNFAATRGVLLKGATSYA